MRQGALTAGWLQREGQITCQVNRVEFGGKLEKSDERSQDLLSRMRKEPDRGP